MGRPAREEYLADPCNVCGAIKGQRCTDSTGKTLSPSKSHKDRMQSYAVLKLKDGETVFDKLVAAEGARIEAEIEAEDEQNAAFAQAREDRIQKVLWAIGLARTMGLSDEQIMRNLAEMIVDSGQVEMIIPLV